MVSGFHWCKSAVVALLLLLVPAVERAAADTVVYYSAAERVYGWCAGFAYNRAHSCARGYCENAGGRSCRAVIECGGGWGAIALPQDPGSGIAAVCGMGDVRSARTWALSHCAAAANTLCWTDVAFNRRGSRTRADSNRAFDRTWYAQAMLQVQNYDVGNADGKLGPNTRKALTEFQSDIGLVANGQLTDETFARLLDALGGKEELVRILDRDVVQKQEKGDFSYAASPNPLPRLSEHEAMLALSPQERALRAGVILTTSNIPCGIPAIHAAPLFDDTPMWEVVCTANSYTLRFTGEGGRLILKR